MRHPRTLVALLGTAWVAVYVSWESWLHAQSRWPDSPVGVVVHFLPVIVLGAWMIAVYPTRARLARQRVPALKADPRRRRFSTVPARTTIYFFGGFPAYLAGVSVDSVRHLVGDVLADPEFTNTGLLLAPFYAVVLAILGFLAYFTVLDPPYVRLTPDGVIVRAMHGRYTAPWDSLAGGLPPEATTKQDELPIRVAVPARVQTAGLAVRRPQWISVPLQWHATDPGFLGYAVWYYLRYPDDRAAIGAQAELDRLRQSYAGLATAFPDTART